MKQARAFHSATLLKNGHVLVAGGGDSISEDCLRPTWNSVHASAEVYDDSTGKWTNVGIMGEARTEHQAILLPSNKVLIAGGKRTSSGRTLATAELYDPDTKSWSSTSRLRKGRSGHSLNLGANGVLAIGGFQSFPPAEGELDVELFPLAPQGYACSLDEQCESAICSGGVCCDRVCDGLCLACSKAAAKEQDKEKNKLELDGVCEDISGCSNFACLPESGQCKDTCTDVDDCVSGYVCNPVGQCIDAIPNASTLDQSGCRAASSESTTPPWGSILLVAGALVMRRYRRPARIHGNS
jgi:Kelch motif